jgi:hypothetical protein
MRGNSVDSQHLTLPAFDSGFVGFYVRSYALDLVPSDDMAAGMDSSIGLYPVELIVAETTVLSIATPVFSSSYNSPDEN